MSDQVTSQGPTTAPTYAGTARVLRQGESARDTMSPDEYARALQTALALMAD